ncbi:MAG: type II secretion system protein [Planctomycetes bacterium]|nr:type II secretion system protein [Planctomycetota bacterium]
MNHPTNTRLQPQRAAAQGGFTLIELVVVMGILSGFLVMLVQLVGIGLRLFSEGELGQALADRSSQAQRVISEELRTLRGGVSGRDRDVCDDRLLVQSLPVGLPPRPEANASQVQVLRGSVHLPPDRELALLEAKITADILREQPDIKPSELSALLAARQQTEPLRGLGNLLLVPWRQADADDAILELRAAWFLPGQRIDLERDRSVDPFEVLVPGSPELPSTVVFAHTEPLLKDLLHVEFAFWSQRTQGWNRTSGSASGGAGPERIWDSARGGWLTDAASGGEWAFDRGAASRNDTTDDIQPHAILVLCVIAQPADLAPEGLLGLGLEADGTELTLLAGDRFPGAADGGWVKVRGEWMHYDALAGDTLRGLRRGQRSTKAIDHPAGVRVHVGRTVEFVIPIPHAKDDWNG